MGWDLRRGGRGGEGKGKELWWVDEAGGLDWMGWGDGWCGID